MKTVNVVSVVVLGSVSALLLCWSGHGPAETEGTPANCSVMTADAEIARDSVAIGNGPCCQSAPGSQMEYCAAKPERIVGHTATD